MEKIRSLAHTDFGTLAEAFGEAFAAYEVQISPGELRAMLLRRGFDPALSFAAFDGEKIAAFTLNGTGTFDGTATAYDTGTGTLPAYRGQGLATRIFEASLPHLRAAGIGQYLLEVLQHNVAAVSVYRKLGFGVWREFNYFRADSADVRPGEGAGEIRPVDPGLVREVAKEWWDFEPAAGDITQLAVAPSHRRRGIGSALLGRMLSLNRAPGIKCINTEIGRDGALAGFLQAKGIPPAGRQFEMILKL